MQIVVHNVKMHSLTEEWFLRPLGDIHYGHPGHDEEMFKESIELIAKSQNYLTLGIGDYVENNTVTGRGAKTFDEEMPLAQKDKSILPSQQIREFIELWKPISSKTIGLHIGNHEDRTINHDLFRLLFTEPLGVKYLGDKAYIILNFTYKGQFVNQYKLITMHSRFGGQFSGTVQMAAMRGYNAYEGFDAILFGHTHYTAVEKQHRKFVDTTAETPQLGLRKYYIVNTGCFVRGEIEGYDNYSDRKFGGGVREPGTVTLRFQPQKGSFHASQ